jgi:WW domain-containing oxidoreductase
MEKVYFSWGDSEEDDITKLPSHCEARVAADGRVYFLNHESKTTCWESPLSQRRCRVERGLPYGWQKCTDEEGSPYYVDHINQYSCLVDPRLLSDSVFELPATYQVRRTDTVPTRFRPLSRAPHIMEGVDLARKVAIVTGANSGLGFATALHLAEKGAHVILACCHMTRATAAMTKIQKVVPGAELEVMELDLASLHSVQDFTAAFQKRHLPLHILVLNAAVFGGPLSHTVDGVERHFAVNHLAHFHLASLLTDALRDSAPSRVVVVASESHWYTTADPSAPLHLSSLPHPPRQTYTATTAYGASKLCNLLFAFEFHRRFSSDGISCHSVHPGNLLATNLTWNAGIMYRLSVLLARPFTKSVEQAAATILYCAAHPSLEGVSGLYWYEFQPVEPSPDALDPDLAEGLWNFSQKLIRERLGTSTSGNSDEM